MIIGIASSFFLLAYFNEQWITSTLVFALCLGFYMERTGGDYFGAELYELIIRAFFASFIYAIIAYKLEVLSKQSFTGRESSDKAFHRWLKIFETFPEGIALVRNNYILYANKSFKHILELDSAGVGGFGGMLPEYDPNNEGLKRSLMQTQIVQYCGSIQRTKGSPDALDTLKPITVWQFLLRNEKGNTYELASRQNVYDQEKASSKKYLTLNQVNVNVAGGRDKLFIVRDVTHIIYLEQIMEKKHQMSLFTDNLMKQILNYAEFASTSLDKLDQHVQPVGKSILSESSNEVQKMIYRIKDFD